MVVILGDIEMIFLNDWSLDMDTDNGIIFTDNDQFIR